MEFTVELDERTVMRIRQAAQGHPGGVDLLARQAFALWLDKHEGQPRERRQQQAWPAEVLDFTGCPDFPPLESHRAEFLPADGARE